jgi:hypothetical protein
VGFGDRLGELFGGSTPVKVIIVDETTQIIKHLRYMTLTQSWWVQLADAFELCPKNPVERRI